MDELLQVLDPDTGGFTRLCQRITVLVEGFRSLADVLFGEFERCNGPGEFSEKSRFAARLFQPQVDFGDPLEGVPFVAYID